MRSQTNDFNQGCERSGGAEPGWVSALIYYHQTINAPQGEGVVEEEKGGERGGREKEGENERERTTEGRGERGERKKKEGR